MGTFAEYSGKRIIPEQQRELFCRHMEKVLNYGGMMGFDVVQMYDKKLLLLKPVRITSQDAVTFHYNYFEDDAWEMAGFDPKDLSFWSNKIGYFEFREVILAAYTLIEMYDQEPGVVDMNGDIIDIERIVGWLNCLLGTQFTVEKCRRLWDRAEAFVYCYDSGTQNFTYDDLIDLIPAGYLEYTGGTEFADLCYITNGTESLTEDEVKSGSYPADVLECRKAVVRYLGQGKWDKQRKRLWELIWMDRDCRKGIADNKETSTADGLSKVAAWSLLLPARVIVYLTAEACELEFWEEWKSLRKKAYRDETMKPYARKELEILRQLGWERPVKELYTSDFLEIDDPVIFHGTPEELERKPGYYLSDDDRMYWWDGTYEVYISKKMNKWMEDLAGRHAELVKELSERNEKGGDPDSFIKDFLMLLSRIEETYQRVYPFQSMYYDFIQNGNKPEYSAAVVLLRELAEEYKEEGKAIRHLKNSWTFASRKVTFNPGRVWMKRYLSIMANRKLRMKYFGF